MLFGQSCRSAAIVSAVLVAVTVCRGEEQHRQAADGVAKIGKQITRFYENPSAEQFATINQQIVQHQDAVIELGKRNRFHVLVATFLARAHEKYDYPIEGTGPIFVLTRDITSQRPGNQLAAFINNDRQVTANKLDIWWTSFFTTGDRKYLDLILHETGDADEFRRVALKQVVRRAANWSFKSNCRNHDAVRKYAEAAIADDRWKSKHEFLVECIHK